MWAVDRWVRAVIAVTTSLFVLVVAASGASSHTVSGFGRADVRFTSATTLFG